MPAAPAPLPFTTDIPNCAYQWLYESGGLHYYATINCGTGTTGIGVSAREIDPAELGCSNGVCKSKAFVDPTILLQSGDGNANRIEFLRQLFGIPETDPVETSPVLATTPNSCDRAMRLFARVAQFGEQSAERIRHFSHVLQEHYRAFFGLPAHLRDAYLALVDAEFRLLMEPLGTYPIYVLDSDLDLNVVTRAELRNDAVTPLSQGVVHVKEGWQAFNLFVGEYPVVEVVVEGHKFYFRLFSIPAMSVVDCNGEVTDFGTHKIGHQISREDLVQEFQNLPNFAPARFVDRHRHMHMISVEGHERVFVYSSDDLSSAALYR